MKHFELAEMPVSRETRDRIDAYVDLLLRWNSKINLIARGDEQRVTERHINDALQLAPLMPTGLCSAIDLGSGGGLPGLVLAIVTNVHFHLVEADKRKAAFLREAARVTAAAATIHNLRVEAVELAPASLVTARAFAPLPRLLELAYRLLAPTGIMLLPKGETADRELTDAAGQWNMVVQKIPSKTYPGATILRLSEVTRV